MNSGDKDEETESHKQKNLKQKMWDEKKRLWLYFAAGILVTLVGLWLFNQRGGLFLVKACDYTNINPDTFDFSKEKCYKLEANMPNGFRQSNYVIKLFFSNGGSLDVTCTKDGEDTTCQSDDGRLWNITAISRIRNVR